MIPSLAPCRTADLSLQKRHIKDPTATICTRRFNTFKLVNWSGSYFRGVFRCIQALIVNLG